MNIKLIFIPLMCLLVFASLSNPIAQSSHDFEMEEEQFSQIIYLLLADLDSASPGEHNELPTFKEYYEMMLSDYTTVVPKNYHYYYMNSSCSFFARNFILDTKLRGDSALDVSIFDFKSRSKYQKSFTVKNVGIDLPKQITLLQIYGILCPKNKNAYNSTQFKLGDFIYPQKNNYNIRLKLKGTIQVQVRWRTSVENNVKFIIQLNQKRRLSLSEVVMYQTLMNSFSLISKMYTDNIKTKSARPLSQTIKNVDKTISSASNKTNQFQKFIDEIKLNYPNVKVNPLFYLDSTIEPFDLFKISGHLISKEKLRGHNWTSLVGRKQIKDKNSFAVKIIKLGKTQMYVGIVEEQLKNISQFYVGQNKFFLGSKGHFTRSEGEDLQLKITFNQEDKIEVVVNQTQGTIKWLVNGKQKHLYQDNELKDLNVNWLPATQMANVHDTIQWLG